MIADFTTDTKVNLGLFLRCMIAVFAYPAKIGKNMFLMRDNAFKGT